MTIRFAAAINASAHPVVRQICRVRMRAAANDNPGGRKTDRLVYEALRHFAQHGLAAARHARACAEDAHFARDRDSYDWWLGICRQLDKRMADECAQTIEKHAIAQPDDPRYA